MKNLKTLPLFFLAFVLLSFDSSNVKLEVKAFFDGKVELKIPIDFEIMSEEMLQLKYPTEQKPGIVYTEETGGINVALRLTENPASQEILPLYVDNFVKTFDTTYPDLNWKDNGVKTINGKEVGFLELVTPAVDTDIYNLLFFTDMNEQLLLCTFNCTKKSMEEWTPIAKEIMTSLKIK